MTVQEVIKVLESRGWRSIKNDDDLRQFKHDSIPGAVTLSGGLDLSIPQAVLRALLRHAQIEKGC